MIIIGYPWIGKSTLAGRDHKYIDLVNAGNQLHFISDEKADNANKNHLKNCIDCYERLGVKMPKAFVDFSKE